MQIALDTGPGSHINAYIPGKITVNGLDYTTPIQVSAAGVTAWELAEFSDLNQALLQQLIAPGLEIIIIGCGTTQAFLEPKLLAWISQQGIGVEIMTTAAACRTYNVLNAEHRKVSAGLLI